MAAPGSSWRDSDRRDRLPANWSEIRRSILTRDRWLCQLRYDGCARGATDVDHVTPGDDHSPANLQAACHSCHARKSASEGVQARATIRARGARSDEQHPGMSGGG